MGDAKFSGVKFAESLSFSAGLTDVLLNPIYTALVIVLIILVVVYFVVRGHWEDEGFWQSMVKMGIYMSIGAVSIMYLHNRFLMQKIRKQYGRGEDEKILTATTNIDVTAGTVSPATQGGAEAGSSGLVEGAKLEPTCIVYGKMPDIRGASGMQLAQPAIVVGPQGMQGVQ